MELFGIKIKTDRKLPDGIIRFEHFSGRKERFNLQGKKVIDIEPTQGEKDE